MVSPILVYYVIQIPQSLLQNVKHLPSNSKTMGYSWLVQMWCFSIDCDLLKGSGVCLPGQLGLDPPLNHYLNGSM